MVALYLSVYVYFMKVAVSSTLHTDLIFSPSAIFSLFSGVEDLEDLSHMLHIPPCHDVCLHSDKKSFSPAKCEILRQYLDFRTFPLILCITQMERNALSVQYT